MSWQGILGHDAVAEQFRRRLAQGRLASTFLFVGPAGIGKRTFALRLAQSMLCTRSTETDLAPCGSCPACQQVLSDSHPDLLVVQKPADRAFIPVETFIGDREHRRRTGLCHFISLTPAGGKRRIAIINDADWLNQEGANSLLKTLEEPSPRAVIILIGTSQQRQLPTIRSRSQVIRFHPLAEEHVAECLINQGLAESAEQARTMAARADGSLSQALVRADEATIDFHRELWQGLAQPTIDRSVMAKSITAFIDSAGKETAAKRENLRHVFVTSMEFYRAVARRRCCVDASSELDLDQAVELACERRTLSAEAATSLVERCVDAFRQVNSNANLAMLIDAWLCDVAGTSRSGQPLLNAPLP